mmetsp:Transcript_27310/g.86091  ORF Transcript_27310/g.86091 Transcript_27310/m.86091 type:complete len:92 (-) Transcript_27310:916-1191(-)
MPDSIQLTSITPVPEDEEVDDASPEADDPFEAYRKNMRETRVNLKQHREILIDPSPFRVSEYMPLEQEMRHLKFGIPRRRTASNAEPSPGR